MKTLILFLITLFSTENIYSENKIQLKIIDSSGRQLSLSQSDLLSRSDCENVVIPKGVDPAHPDREMIYRAIKIRNLFADLAVDKKDLLAFKATDGFSAPLLLHSSDIALGRSKSKDGVTAYLAIEEEKSPWPEI